MPAASQHFPAAAEEGHEMPPRHRPLYARISPWVMTVDEYFDMLRWVSI